MSVDHDWSELPPELLYTIVNNLTNLNDYLHFRAVCSTWRSSTPTTPKNLPIQLPWLMLPKNRSNLRGTGFFNLVNNKLHFLSLPEASNHRRRRCGSSNGWLIIVDESPLIFMINPITKVTFNLPPVTEFPNVVNFDFYCVGREYTVRSLGGEVYTRSLKEMRDSFIRKVVISNSPSRDPNFIAMVILNETGELAYCKNGENSWRFIDDARFYAEDVIYFDGLFYAVHKSGEIAVCDLSGGSPSVSFIETPRQIGSDMQYLVKTNDELLLVTRFLELDIDAAYHQLDVVYKTVEFRVFRLDLDGPKWEIMNSLGDNMLFLGENSSLALLASDFPGCEGNRIYFTDDYCEANYDGVNGNHDLGYYNLEDGSIEALSCYPRNSHSMLRWPPPIWFTPNPC
ncbi:F-box protein SKIP23-like [Lycium barbarum]|uniref:F-box protein SKIP23-like n=1 Tax=Lycium barbarum TaxID=112863 RepID=UPI00293E2AC2|nr:F-box protein SKIP23-like [Lycium barbarum]